ncbi:MAG: glycosyltransferase family 4 protein [Candidatus Lokiarchaeota archaeon]
MEKISDNFENLGKYSKFLLLNKDYKFISTVRRKSKSNTEKFKPRILRILCQKPYFTGSGINFVNLTRKAKQEKIDQFLIFGHSAGEDIPLTDLVNSDYISPIVFQNPKHPEMNSEVSFPVAGMSDKMPYQSTTFSSFNFDMLEEYLAIFANKIEGAITEFKPNIIHTHHLWLVTALARVLNPKIPIITTCHNTALRQMVLASQFQPFVLEPIHNVDLIAINNQDQCERVKKVYQFNRKVKNQYKFLNIGQGINTEVFHPPKVPQRKINKKAIDLVKRIIYAGKLSFSKGVLQLIEAFKRVSETLEGNYELYIIGSGVGEEKNKIIESAKGSKNKIYFLGQITQSELAQKFRESDLFILPSFYDGFPKVMLEALACGCKVIITEIPGVKENMQNLNGSSKNLRFIPLPRMKTIDQPFEENIPTFTSKLKSEMINILSDAEINKKDIIFSEKVRTEFGSDALFKKYLKKYRELIKT